MTDVQKWIDNPKRGYKAGLKLYNQNKIDKRHDDFFDTDEPGRLHTNMLYAQLLKINSKLKRNAHAGDQSEGNDSKKKSSSRSDKSKKVHESKPIDLSGTEPGIDGNIQGNKTTGSAAKTKPGKPEKE